METGGRSSESDEMRPEDFRPKFERAIQESLKLRGQTGVMVIGPTRAGKSSFIAYMMGHTMKMVRGNLEVERGAAPGVDLPKISHAANPETSLIQGYEMEETFKLIDCPGFGDDREAAALGNINDAVVSLNIDFVAKKILSSLKGLVVMVQYRSLEGNAQEFKVLLKNLSRFLLNPASNGTSIQWIITNSLGFDPFTGEALGPEGAKERVVGRLEAIKAGLDTGGHLDSAMMLGRILSCADKIHVLRAIDYTNGDFRERMKPLLRASEPINPRDCGSLLTSDLKRDVIRMVAAQAEVIVRDLDERDACRGQIWQLDLMRSRELELKHFGESRKEELRREFEEVEGLLKRTRSEIEDQWNTKDRIYGALADTEREKGDILGNIAGTSAAAIRLIEGRVLPEISPVEPFVFLFPKIPLDKEREQTEKYWKAHSEHARIHAKCEAYEHSLVSIRATTIAKAVEEIRLSLETMAAETRRLYPICVEALEPMRAAQVSTDERLSELMRISDSMADTIRYVRPLIHSWSELVDKLKVKYQHLIDLSTELGRLKGRVEMLEDNIRSLEERLAQLRTHESSVQRQIDDHRENILRIEGGADLEASIREGLIARALSLRFEGASIRVSSSLPEGADICSVERRLDVVEKRLADNILTSDSIVQVLPLLLPLTPESLLRFMVRYHPTDYPRPSSEGASADANAGSIGRWASSSASAFFMPHSEGVGEIRGYDIRQAVRP